MVALPPPGKNGLYYGDNWDILRTFPDSFVDLVYIDPPFNSDRNYNVVFDGSVAEEQAFTDTWSFTGIKEEWEVIQKEPQRYAVLIDYLNAMETLLGRSSGLYCYLLMMSVRVVELHRVLKPTGSFYLHCDPTASHYLKTLLDKVFGADNFRNEIIWRRTFSHNDSTRYGANHDSILFYSKGKKWIWTPQYTPHRREYIERDYRHAEGPKGDIISIPKGQDAPAGYRRFRQDNLTANKPGGDVSYEWKGAKPYKGRYWAYSKANMEEFERQGKIIYRSTGMPVFKRFLDEQPGVPLQTFWDDVLPIISGSNEGLGYPTQKPIALMERILSASSKKGDLVLDAFCGCGTTVAAAEKLDRKWIGIDITFRAVELIHNRLTEHYYGKNEATFKQYVHVHGVPKDVESATHLAKQTDKLRKQFEMWACNVVGGVFQEKKGADGGQDGFIPIIEDGKMQQCVIQVKSGGIGLKDAKELNSTIEQFKAKCGLLFTIEPPTKPIMDYINGLPPYRPKWGGAGMEPVPRIQVITVAEHFDGKRPNLPGRIRLDKEAEPIQKAGPKQKKLGSV